MSQYTAFVEEFVRSTERFGWTDEVARKLLHREYIQTELPNLLNRKGQTSTLAETLSRSELSKKILKSQTYEITSMLASGETVVMEATWSGEMLIDAGPLKSGQTLKAFFCMVFEFKEGQIYRIRNYDCFEAF